MCSALFEVFSALKREYPNAFFLEGVRISTDWLKAKGTKEELITGYNRCVGEYILVEQGMQANIHIHALSLSIDIATYA